MKPPSKIIQNGSEEANTGNALYQPLDFHANMQFGHRPTRSIRKGGLLPNGWQWEIGAEQPCPRGNLCPSGANEISFLTSFLLNFLRIALNRGYFIHKHRFELCWADRLHTVWGIRDLWNVRVLTDHVWHWPSARRRSDVQALAFSDTVADSQKGICHHSLQSLTGYS